MPLVHLASGNVDIGMWTVGGQTLVMATNLEYTGATVDLDDILGGGGSILIIINPWVFLHWLATQYGTYRSADVGILLRI